MKNFEERMIHELGCNMASIGHSKILINLYGIIKENKYKLSFIELMTALEELEENYGILKEKENVKSLKDSWRFIMRLKSMKDRDEIIDFHSRDGFYASIFSDLVKGLVELRKEKEAS